MFDMSGAPDKLVQEDVIAVGDIMRKVEGTPGFFWIVAMADPKSDYSSTTAIYLTIDRQGTVTGSGRCALSYFVRNESRKVGHADVPMISPEWF